MQISMFYDFFFSVSILILFFVSAAPPPSYQSATAPPSYQSVAAPAVSSPEKNEAISNLNEALGELKTCEEEQDWIGAQSYCEEFIDQMSDNATLFAGMHKIKLQNSIRSDEKTIFKF